MGKTYINGIIDLKYKINDYFKIKKINYWIDYNYSQGKIELILYHMNKNGFYENTIQNRQLNLFLGYGSKKEIYKTIYGLYSYIVKSKDIKYLSFNK